MSRVVLLALLAGTACNTAHQGTYEVAAAAATDNTDVVRAGADALWEQRGDVEKLKQSLAAYEQVAAANPGDTEVLLHLVRGYYFLGDGHLTEKEAKLAAFDQSVSWGKRCMATNSEFVALLDKGDETEGTAARAITDKEAPCMYWTSAALGKWAGLQGLPKILANKDIAFAWMNRVLETLGPDYFFGATGRYFGAYYAALPSFAGQDLERSRKEFDAVIAKFPDHFGNRVLLAEYWAVKAQDRALYLEQLDFVINGDPNVIPEIAAEQEAEQRKAVALKAAVDDKFAN